MANRIAIRRNPKLTPTFEKGEFVFLTKDVDDHSEIIHEDDPYNEYFKKDCVFIVVQCGMCKHFIGETDQTLNYVDGEEYCVVESASNSLDDDGMVIIEGTVRATDLQPYRFDRETS